LASFAALLFTGSAVFGQGIEAKTDIKSYYVGQDVKITFLNMSDDVIYSIAASSTPQFAINRLEKKEPDGSWAAYEVNCSMPECDIDFDAPVAMQPQNNAIILWKPQVYVKGDNGKNRLAQPGTYRIILNYQIRESDDSKDWRWLEARTNEFELK
jgi:hypothetical protein